MSDCQRCRRPVQDAHVCTRCGDDLARALGDVPWLDGELEVTIAKQRRFAAASDGGRSAETPLPLHVAASTCAGTLRAVLVGWTRLYVEEAGADYPAGTLTGMARFLLRRVEWLRHHEAAADCVDEIREAVSDCRRVVDAPSNRTTFPVGPCPEADEAGVPCPGEVRAYIPADESAAAWMGCTVCRHRYESHQWLRAGRRILDRIEAGR